MNILMLIYEYPPIGGGAGACAKEQAKGLAALGHKVVVVTTWYHGEQEETTDDNLKIIKLKVARKHKHKSGFYEKMAWAFSSWKYLKQNKDINTFDVCIAHFTLPGAYVAHKLKNKFDIPYVVVSHGHDIPWFFPRQMFIYHLLLYPYLKYLVNKAAAIVTLNKKLQKNAASFTKQSDKVVLIPNGCAFKEGIKAQRPYNEKLKIIFTGRLVAQKAPMTFLKGIHLLALQNTDFSVDIYGDGPLKKKMAAFVKKHKLTAIVNFKGWVSKYEMDTAYNASHVHVMTSREEAMSVAALESLAAGLYLISTDVGDNAALINEGVNGKIIPKNKPEVLAACLQKYYTEKYKHNYEVPEQQISFIRKNYDWAHIVLQYESLLKSIVKI